MKKFIAITLISSLFLTLSSCQAWLEFDAKRIFYGFIFTLIIGVVAFIISLFSNKKN